LKCETKERATKKKAPKDRANWGAHELPKYCRHCKSVHTEIVTTKNMTSPDRKVRYRRCLDCKKRFSTLDVNKGATV